MSKYFQHFPYILYNDEVVTDITRRSSVLKKLKGNPYLFLPYTIKEGDTIETIADDYYGDPGLSWLIVMANNIIDPIADFFKDYQIWLIAFIKSHFQFSNALNFLLDSLIIFLIS